MVQEQSITKEDIVLQQKTDSCYNAPTSESIALIEIINKMLEEEVLATAFKKRITQQEMESKSQWVNQNSKAPNILACVKKHFEKHQQRYLELYIKPTLVNPALHHSYNFSKSLHADKMQRCKEIKDSLDHKWKPLEAFKEYRKWEVPKKMAVPDELLKTQPELVEQELPFIKNVIRRLSPGKIFPDIYEDEYTFIIPRLLSEDKENWYMDGIVVPKRPFDEWFREQVKNNIVIHIKDKELMKKLKEEYSHVFWVNYLHE